MPKATSHRRSTYKPPLPLNPTPDLSAYEQERQATIQANRELLISLGLVGPEEEKVVGSVGSGSGAGKGKGKGVAAKNAPNTPTRFSARSKSMFSLSLSHSGPGSPSASLTDTLLALGSEQAESSTSTTTSRRSGRVASKVTIYNTKALKYRTTSGTFHPILARGTESKRATAEISLKRSQTQVNLQDFIIDDNDDEDALKLSENARGTGAATGRIHDPKVFGAIEGVEVGRRWEFRSGASRDAVHAPLVACISGNADVGAWSICFSGGYEDNVDGGESFVLTGAGGRDLKGTPSARKNLRTAPQSFDQSFEHNMNASLLKSSQTGKPVRVMRGFKTDCDWAPAEGYRYDGLYKVVSAELVMSGFTKYRVCKFRFQRLPGQPPISRRSDVLDTAQAAEIGSIILGKAPEPASEADDVLMI